MLCLCTLLAPLTYTVATFKLVHHWVNFTEISKANTAGLYLARDSPRPRADPLSVTEQPQHSEEVSLRSSDRYLAATSSWQHSSEDLDRVRQGTSSMSTRTAAWNASPTYASSVITLRGSVQGTPGTAEWRRQVMNELPLVLEGLASMVWVNVPILLSFLCHTAWLFCCLLFHDYHVQTELFLYLVLDVMLGESPLFSSSI